jgi:hypothetical protein
MQAGARLQLLVLIIGNNLPKGGTISAGDDGIRAWRNGAPSGTSRGTNKLSPNPEILQYSICKVLPSRLSKFSLELILARPIPHLRQDLSAPG